MSPSRDADDDLWSDDQRSPGAGRSPSARRPRPEVTTREIFDDEPVTSSGPRRPPRRDSRVPAVSSQPERRVERHAEAEHPRDGHNQRVRDEYEADLHDVDDDAVVYDDDEYEDEFVDLPTSDKLPRWVLVLGAFLTVIALIVGSITWWYNRQIDPPGKPHGKVTVEVYRETGISSMGDVLKAKGVISNAYVYNFWASRQSLGTAKKGVFTMQKNMSFPEAVKVLEGEPKDFSAGVGTTVDVIFPEGVRVSTMLERIGKESEWWTVAELQAALDKREVTSEFLPAGSNNYEGLLFPAKYDFGENESAATVLQKLADQMEIRVSNYDPDAAIKKINEQYGLDLTPYDAIKVASMIQGEAANAEEAPQVASVIYNRLGNGAAHAIPSLGIDAVDQYGADLEGVSLSAYQAGDGPYNTRRVPGLPPTPIAAPGDYALEAAFAPATTDFYYYVLTAPGVHSFVATKAEFDQKKRECKAQNLCG